MKPFGFKKATENNRGPDPYLLVDYILASARQAAWRLIVRIR